MTSHGRLRSSWPTHVACRAVLHEVSVALNLSDGTSRREDNVPNVQMHFDCREMQRMGVPLTCVTDVGRAGNDDEYGYPRRDVHLGGRVGRALASARADAPDGAPPRPPARGRPASWSR